MTDTDLVRPVRVQLRRTKGWRMPANTVTVARQAKEYGFGEATILLAAAARDIKRGEHRKDEHG